MRIHGAVASACLIVLSCQGPADRAPRDPGSGVPLDDGPTLTARVLDPGGRPGTGAEVWLLSDVDSPASFVNAKIAAAVTGDLVETVGWLRSAAVRADEAGLARLPLGSAKGPGMVVARGDSGFAQVELAELAGGESIELVLAPMGRAEVDVVDRSGAPVGGVGVSLALRDVNGALDTLPVTAVTGADGRAVLRWPGGTLPSAGSREAVVVARLATAGPIVAPLLLPGDRTRLAVPTLHGLRLSAPRLQPGNVTLSGVVTVFPAAHGSRSDATLGTLIAGDAVALPPVEPGVPLNAVAILAMGERAGAQGLMGRVEWGVPPDEIAAGELTVPLAAHSWVTGRIEGGKAGDVVKLGLPGRPRSQWEARADGDGRFHWLVRGRGPARIRVAARGSERVIEVELPGGGTQVDLGALVM